jgi:hypothetical protein
MFTEDEVYNDLYLLARPPAGGSRQSWDTERENYKVTKTWEVSYLMMNILALKKGAG